MRVHNSKVLARIKVTIRFLNMLYRTLVVGVTIVCMLATVAGAPKRSKMQKLTKGTWGGMHIRIDVTAAEATVEYDCANGIIDGPLSVAANGTFSWSGIHRRERGGPIRKDAPSRAIPATYTGSIRGDTMTLTVKLKDADEDDETYTLKRGSVGNVFKCK